MIMAFGVSTQDFLACFHSKMYLEGAESLSSGQKKKIILPFHTET